MDNAKIGLFIAELRKKQGLTQKELADKLSVTDKAVSKWERGAGYPEITILPTLAESLGVTLGELLGGEKNGAGTETVVTETIAYVTKVSRFHYLKNTKTWVAGISGLFLLSIFICMTVNIAVSGKVDWALYPTGGLAVAWMTLMPLIKMKKHKYTLSLTGLSVSLVPFLFLVEALSKGDGWVLPLGLPVSALGLAALWVSVWLWVYTKLNRLTALAVIAFLFGDVVNIGVNLMVGNFLNQPQDNIANTITALVFGFVSIMLLIAGTMKKKSRA